jgi:NAD(P) transhydrogenase subunit beta
MSISLLTVIYLIASVTFILGLKMLSHPESARRGNQLAAGGMGLAILGTIFLYQDEDVSRLRNLGWIFAAIALGTLVGWMAAKKVKMTAMPEMVSLFNGMGGACAALISISEFNHFAGGHNESPGDLVQLVAGSTGLLTQNTLLIILVGLIIGTVSFAGSMIAWAKLNGRMGDYSFQGQTVLNIILLCLTLALAGFLLINGFGKAEGSGFVFPALTQQHTFIFYAIFLLAIFYGVMFVLPIGGADMPVVISLLNSFTGVAAACGGFLYDNKAMLTGGILVGAAGTLLTLLMCKAMNRSLSNVLIGSFGGGAAASGGTSTAGGAHKEIKLSDAAVAMAYANKVMIVPGYGLAVAQAQHTCHELEKLLEERGVEVMYAIHPVAGRMPGHMNVLLAESDVPYEKLLEMEDANDGFANTDVVLILGANDVVNPAAKTDPASPIYGMPILEVEKAKLVVVNKRSMKPGYAGIENALFYSKKTSMLFGDAKKVLQDLVGEIKSM